MKKEELMDKIVSLAKRRGFIFPGSEIYGGLSGTWDYGPLGVELRKNIKDHWWNFFVRSRENIYGIDSAILMSAKVWQASGHAESFADTMVDCKKCKNRFRVDKIEVEKGCPDCGAKDFTEAKSFNTMFKTYVGPVENDASITYLRPETAQGMFVNFKNIIDTIRPKLPFGIAQIGKAFRNEITTGNFIFRSREFEQMEIEYFLNKDDWEKPFNSWLGDMHEWSKKIGISKLHDREVPDDERAHYSKRTVDLDFDFPFGREELYGLAYRTDFDLKNHIKMSGEELYYYDEEKNTKVVPHVIEPTFGVDRTVLALLVSSYREEKVSDGTRAILSFKPSMAPYKIAVFPLVSNKVNIVKKARSIYENLGTLFTTAWDDIGNVGKRYRRQDEIGTPWCVTVDYETLENNTVTVRDRDTMKQERLNVSELEKYFTEQLK